MAGLKVFVSSTCYDLGLLRSELRPFLVESGHEPKMSDQGDVLYDPRIHTHTSCLTELKDADAVVLVIGGRHGGVATAEAISTLDLDKLVTLSQKPSILSEVHKLSITQVEVLTAISESIPVYTFVHEHVLHDHHSYELNKPNVIKYPSIDKQETAKYIFEFINFIKARFSNNSILSFSTINDIKTNLSRQWSSLFGKLLRESRKPPEVLSANIENNHVFRSRHEMPSFRTVISGKSTVWLAGKSLNGLLGSYGKVIADTANNGTSYKVLIHNNENDLIISTLASLSYTNPSKDKIKSMLTDSLTMLRSIRDKCHDGKIQIKVTDTLLPSGLTITDPDTDHGLIYVENFSYKISLSEKLSMYVTKKSPSIFSFYYSQYDSLWKDAKEVQ